MKPFARAAALIAAMSLLSACGAGGHASPIAPTAAPTSTVAPAASARGTVTVKFAAVHTLSAAAKHRIRASAASRRAHANAKRKPKFVDPDGSYFEFDDYSADSSYSAGSSTEIEVAPNYNDGTQTLSVSLVSGDSNLYIYEYDSDGTEIAFGSASPMGVVAGSTVPLTVTLAMQPVGIAITTDLQNGEDAEPISSDPTNTTSWGYTCEQAYEASYLLAYDDAGSYELAQTPVGLGGIPIPSIVSQSSENGGTSRFSTDISGGLHIAADYNNDPIDAHMQILDQNGNPINDPFGNAINGYLTAAQYDTNCG